MTNNSENNTKFFAYVQESQATDRTLNGVREALAKLQANEIVERSQTCASTMNAIAAAKIAQSSAQVSQQDHSKK